MLLLGCKTELEEVHPKNEQGQYRVLIAGVNGGAKQQIRQQFIDRYKGYCDIRVVNLDKLKGVKLEDYNLVLVIDAAQGGMRFNNPE